MRSLGAIPQVMAFSELYQGLQSGVVDGCENTPSNMYTQKVYEVQKDTTVSLHGHISYAVVVNKKFWEGLPADLRTTLEGCMKDATTYANAIADTENQQSLEKIKASGKTTVYTLTPEEREEWKKAMFVVHKEMEGRIGKDAIQAVYKSAGFVPPKA
jgi:C4-dicarboxylate-binding protein DctP